MTSQRAFVAIRADMYGDIGLPDYTARIYYLFSTGYAQHIFNLNNLSPTNRYRLTLYPSSSEMAHIPSEGYNAPDNRSGVDSTWACTDIPETIVEKLAGDPNVAIVFAHNARELSTLLHAINSGKDPFKVIERERRIYRPIEPQQAHLFIWQYTACPKPTLQ